MYRRLLWVSLICWFPVAAQAIEATIAIAANFAAAGKFIAAHFEQSSGHQIRLVLGATGALSAQIENGAPFDALLAADSATPERLIKNGQGVAATRRTYAIGRLALWSPKNGYVDAQGAVLKTGAFKHLAVANPRLAPYGAAAREVLTRQGVYQRLAPRLVEGSSIAQTYQFVESGNAELGFVALSQIMTPGQTPSGSYWLPPQALYAPLRQDALLLEHGRANAAAQAFLEFLRTPAAQAIIRSFGYELAA